MTHAPHRSFPPADFHIVDLFAGPGGLDIAATIMGVKSIGVEWDDATRATRQAAGLRTATVKDVSDLGPGHPEVCEANVLTGGPPCQTFTVAGNREGHKALKDVQRLAERMGGHADWASFSEAWAEVKAETDAMSDPRTGLVLQPLRWVMEAKLRYGRPYRSILLEQVPTVIPVWRVYAAILESAGYTADAQILRTEEFGVPQTRRRAVLIARWGKDAEVTFPRPTHQHYRQGAVRIEGEERPSQDSIPGMSDNHPAPRGWVAMRDVLSNRTGSLANRPEDFVVVSNYGSGGNPKARGRRTSDQPAATVTGKVRRNRVFRLKGGKIGEELERLSFEEAGLLQSFPADYPWQSTDVAQQIGNAIPPRLSLHILSSALGLEQPGPELFDKLVAWKRPERMSSLVPVARVYAEAH
ncbi:DNA cytosine methyltransferase [Streptomyces sp. AM 4-1-1]|uniref:DNA cytosine methyltransferase n=1 Tax=Streptomyces sp. AM 4-1-1 TaxID=3028710 RepID=UPI0023B9F990|nr:DNA cytosine methyltransferase [Streptomyces sp. AM 4-1-1]WEH33581.1 DNA cytosine methyltransferase [Streptomyces sp. AM 4-1-1]